MPESAEGRDKERVFTDVRMRGFGSRVRVEQALEWIDGVCRRQLPAEECPLESLAGRVLAEPVVAELNVPSFDRSAMDGYAVVASDCDGASSYNPIRLQIVGESLPGRPCSNAVQSGQACRIMTGSPIPAGATAVVPAEYAQESSESVELTSSVPSGRNIGRQGEDVSVGDRLLSPGRILRPQDLGLLASIGKTAATVRRRPRVRILITGDELVQPGQTRTPFQIYDSNRYLLQSLVQRDGAELTSIEHLDDCRDSIREWLLRPDADVVLVSGGSSVGAEDHAPSLVAEYGELAIHGIAMRPSSPAGMGLIENRCVFLLPGNPVSCLCAYDFFAGRAIRLLGGRSPDWPYPRQQMVVARKIVSAVGRVDYCRVAIEPDGISPIAISGASILSSTTLADGFVIVPADSEGLAPGATVTVMRYEPG